jgi:predicted DNA-binding transcriptional regulator AlpA
MQKFLSKKEFATLIGVSVSTVDRGISGKTWPYDQYVRLGQRVLYPATLIDKIEAECGKEASGKEKEAVIKTRKKKKAVPKT